MLRVDCPCRYSARYHNFGEGIATKTVASEETACNLSCGIETRDWLAMLVEYPSTGVYPKTAHSVVKGWGKKTYAEPCIINVVGALVVATVSLTLRRTDKSYLMLFSEIPWLTVINSSHIVFADRLKYHLCISFNTDLLK